MAVLKHKIKGKYVNVYKEILMDVKLSIAERGLLVTLLSLPDDWDFTIQGLRKILPDGKDRIASTLNSLIDKGYVTRIQSRNTNGNFNSTNLEIHESPINPDYISDDNESEFFSDHSETPCAENPDTDNPIADNTDTASTETDTPVSEKPSQYNNIKSINNELNNNELTNNRVCSADTLTESEYDELTSEFGKALVDYQISRINGYHYQGCYNFETIKKWCRERTERESLPKPKKNSFLDHEESPTDYEAIYEKLIAN